MNPSSIFANYFAAKPAQVALAISLLYAAGASNNALAGPELSPINISASNTSIDAVSPLRTSIDSASSQETADDNEPDQESKFIAQAAALNSSGSTVDLAPVRLPERTTAISRIEGFKTGIFYKLPSKLFVTGTCENSLRIETNVLQTLTRNRADMIYRVLPNITVGYALNPRTRVSSNYFFLRDQYTRNSHFLSRNIHSIGFRIDRDLYVGPKTTVTASFFARELLLSRSQALNDLLPSIQVVRRVGRNTAIYGGVLGQIRFRNVLGKFQEGDQFYSFGAVKRTPKWTFLADNTFITNFGNRTLRFGPNNQVFVVTLEAARKIHPVLPMVAFFRTEPIFNIGANQATGFAGVNVRVFGGLRLEFAKPPIFPLKLNRRA
ncbi:MAG: hypothetical protein K2W82_05155 [Candidatus Obscuribacterales bacterium]|nr:hypothetical protein [Candidatus Obscuribacterales bacterium]